MEVSAGIHYQYDFYGHAETLVFSNSLGCDLSMWEEQAAFFSPHFNVLRYDTRGHGKSEVTQGEYSIEMLANDVIDLLDKLGIEKVLFCGISMGGLIGQYLGIHAPQRIHKLIIANTAAKIGTVASWNSRIKEVNENGLLSIVSATEGRWFTPNFSEENPETIKKILAVFAATSSAGYRSCCAAVRDADFMSTVSKITLPTLIISGTEDLSTTVLEGEYLKIKIPNSKLVTLKAAHISNIECKDKFNKTVLHFIKKE